LDEVSKSIGAVAQQVLEMQHKVNVLIVRETVGRREASRVEGEKPVLNAQPLRLDATGQRPHEGPAQGWDLIV